MDLAGQKESMPQRPSSPPPLSYAALVPSALRNRCKNAQAIATESQVVAIHPHPMECPWTLDACTPEHHGRYIEAAVVYISPRSSLLHTNNRKTEHAASKAIATGSGPTSTLSPPISALLEINRKGPDNLFNLPHAVPSPMLLHPMVRRAP